MTPQIKLPNVTLAGRYKIEIRRHGKLIDDTGWFDNLITNTGLEAIGEAKEIARYCMLGTDNTAPSNTNTILGAQVALKDGATSVTSGIVTSAPRYGWQRKTYAFPQGAVIGNIAEVGVGWSTTEVFSRSLVTPTKSALAIDQVTVVYEIRMYLPTADTTGTVTIDGTDYDYVIRPAWAASASYAGYQRGWAPNLLGIGASARQWCSYNSFANFYGAWSYGPPAVIQTNVETETINQTDGGSPSPTGIGAYASSCSNSAYVPNSKTCKFTLTWGIDLGNGSGGIKAFIYSGLFGTYQCVLDGAIPKDNTKTLSMEWSQSWARRA